MNLPFLKWVGGKRWQLPLLQAVWQKHGSRRLVEPFCGGLSVALGLNPQSALLSDTNEHLINLYVHLQGDRPFDMDELPNDYTSNRAWFNLLVRHGQSNSFEAALVFYYLMRTGFNGLCRFNSAGEFNVPKGSGRAESLPVDHPARVAIRRWDFRCTDYRDLLFSDVSSPDFIYADPPYDGGFTRYTGVEFTWPNQVDLATRLMAHPGPVMITNAATPRVLDLYRSMGFHTQVLQAPRRIAASGNRDAVSEVIATSFVL